MSLKTWKAEFLPISANRAAERYGAIKCIEHSLQKWKGALPENAKKHDVNYGQYTHTLIDINDKSKGLDFDSETCSLCAKYFDRIEGMHECEACPIVVAGNHSCMEGPKTSPYSQSGSNPKIMIAVLEDTLKFYKDGNHKKVTK